MTHPPRPLARALLAACLSVPALTALPAHAACSEGASCADLGSFTVEARRVTVAEKPYNHNTATRIVRLQLRVANKGSEPLVLAYRSGSLHLSDDLGLDYSVGKTAGVSGIGVADGRKADPQLRLEPGQTRDFQLEASKGFATKPSRTPLGAVFSADLALVELQLQSYQRIEVKREHAVSLTGLTGTGAAPLAALGTATHGNATAVQGVVDAFKALGKKH